ncbi:MAG: hypothetical protein JJT85_00345 [Chromatiales bacterium]|nr:hypothetical protein [Chromatiales bacterium]
MSLLPRPALLLSGLLCGLNAGVTLADEVLRTGEVRDLAFGEVLFHFYQDDHFTALNKLLVARSRSGLGPHREEAELLLGGLYLHYGQHDAAERIFGELLTASVAPGVRNRAWFYLGKVRYQRGLFEQALAAFDRIEGRLPRALAAELPMLAAQSHMALGRFDEAAALLDRWRGPADWVPFARYNLGVALVRLGEADAGMRVLDRIGRANAGSAELRGLRDQANLALGYVFLQQQDAVNATPVLERIRLEGPFSNKALLGVGWAEAAREDYSSALTPWLALRERDLLDSAVQEALLAVPYALGRMAAHAAAAREYQAALAAYDDEIARLDRAIAQAEAGTLVPALLELDDPGITHWYWELGQVPDAPETRYLYHLMADHAFQESLRNYRDLQALEAHLAGWRAKLATYDDMVETRRTAWRERMPQAEARLGDGTLAGLERRRDALALRLDEIARERDIAGLATAGEREYVEWLEDIAQQPAFAHAPDETLTRHRVLSGTLSWTLDKEFAYRLWQHQRALAALDHALDEARARSADVALAGATRPDELAVLAARIDVLRPRLDGQSQQVAALRARHGEQLVALAVQGLLDQRERLASYRLEAQFALATIYDRASGTARVSDAPEALP